MIKTKTAKSRGPKRGSEAVIRGKKGTRTWLTRGAKRRLRVSDPSPTREATMEDKFT